MSNRYQFLASYTLSKAKDTAATNLLGDRYGFFQIERYGAADRRHRLVDQRHRAAAGGRAGVGDRRLPIEPAVQPDRARCDLNGDGYTGDLPAGVLPGTGCRDLNLDAVNAFRAARGLTRGDARSTARASPTSTCGCRRSSASASAARGVHRAAVQHLQPRELQRAERQHHRRQRSRPAGRCSARARRCCRTSTRRRGRRSSPCGSSSDGAWHGRWLMADGQPSVVVASS